MNQSSLYDIEAEEDTIYILRAQNKKIKELYQEIENKDQIIYNMQNDTSQYEEYQRQILNFKNQIHSREEKIKILENSLQDTNKTTNDHLKKAAEVEHILRNQIISKEKVLSELNETIKQYESHSNKIKNDLGEKSLTITKLKNNIEDLNTLNKNYLLKISLADEEIKSLKNENENFLKNLNGNKIKFEDKTDELIDLIKQQNYELNLFTINFKKIEKENLQLKTINTNYKNEIESLIDNINQIKESIERFSKIEERVKESEILISDLQSIIESERNKNIEIQKKLIDANEKNNHLLIKSEENENLIQLLKNKDEEINNIHNKNEMISNVIKEKDLKINHIENEIKKFSNYVCDYLITVTQWVDTYLGVYINFNFHSKNHFNFEIPELIFEKLNFNDDHTTMMVNENNYSQCNNNLNMISNSFSNSYNHNFSNFFDLFKLNLLIEKFSNILMVTRSKINEEFNNYDDTVTEIQNFNENLSLTNDELIKENSQFKKENSEFNDYLNSEKDSNKKLNIEVKSLKEILDSVEQNRTELQKSHNKFLEMFLKDFQEVEKFIKNLPQHYHFDEFVSKHTLNENIKDRLKDSLENFFQILKNILADLDSTCKKVEEIKKIKIECENLKHQCENLKKNKSEEKHNILKDKNEQISNLEKMKVTQLNKKDEEYKTKLEQVKFELNEKTENNEKLKNESELIKSQIELTEKNFENYKLIKKEQEHNLIEKYEKLIEDNKTLEKTISDMKIESEIKHISFLEKSEKIQDKIRHNFENSNTLVKYDQEERNIK